MTSQGPPLTLKVVPVSGIIPTIGRPESLRRLLTSILAQTVRPLEVIVADGSSDDQTEEVLIDPMWAKGGLSVRRVVVQPPHAVRQRQTAIAQAEGELLLLLDDDIVLEPDCLQRMVESLALRPDATAVMSTFANQPWPRPTTIWRWYLACRGIRGDRWQGRVIGPLLRFGFPTLPKDDCVCDWLPTGNSLVRRTSYHAAGGFSNFFLHRCTMNEDVDLGLKLSRLGPILFCPVARMEHHHDPGGRMSPHQVAEDDLHNRYLIMRKTMKMTKSSAIRQLLLFFVLESAGNAAGIVRHRRFRGLAAVFAGRLRAIANILMGRVG